MIGSLAVAVLGRGRGPRPPTFCPPLSSVFHRLFIIATDDTMFATLFGVAIHLCRCIFILGWISDWFLTEDEGQVYIFDDSNFEYVICINHSEHWHAPRPQSCGTTKNLSHHSLLASFTGLKLRNVLNTGYKFLSLTYKILTTSPATYLHLHLFRSKNNNNTIKWQKNRTTRHMAFSNSSLL